jgi:hypothetical protein
VIVQKLFDGVFSFERGPADVRPKSTVQRSTQRSFTSQHPFRDSDVEQELPPGRVTPLGGESQG